jgi:hypothetical protein
MENNLSRGYEYEEIMIRITGAMKEEAVFLGVVQPGTWDGVQKGKFPHCTTQRNIGYFM